MPLSLTLEKVCFHFVPGTLLVLDARQIWEEGWMSYVLFTHTHTHARTHTHREREREREREINIYVYIHTYIDMYIRSSLYICIHSYICIYMYIYIYTFFFIEWTVLLHKEHPSL